LSNEIRNPYLRQSLYDLVVKRGSGELTPDEETLFGWVRFCTLKKYRYLYEYREIANPLLERKEDDSMRSGEDPKEVCRILGIQTERYLSWLNENYESYESNSKYNAKPLHGSTQTHGKVRMKVTHTAGAGIYENLIHRNFNPPTRGEKFSIGIGIYNTKADGPIYLAGMIDMYDKSAAGIALGGYRSSELAGAAMDMILESKKVRTNVPVIHSSQNPIYRSKTYHQEVEDRGVIPSMTSPGERGGNAVISTFFSQIKRRMRGCQFENWQDAVDWIENDLLLHRVAGVR